MKSLIQILIILIISLKMDAQNSSNQVAGEYYLRGVMETASGFKLNTDSSFEFFFSQGALDRFGTGKWNVKDGQIILNSRTKPPVDFVMSTSKEVPGDSITIRLVDNNTMLLHYLESSIKTATGVKYSESNREGILQFPKEQIEEITLHFVICGERVSVFKPQNKNDNYFEFKFEPWIAEVFCTDLLLKADGKNLIGSHPLLQGNKYTYEKAR